MQDDKKVKHILISGLSSDEFFCIARCKSAKEIWKMIEVNHEGTADVRKARKHILVSEYGALRMKNGETISKLRTRFTHIANHHLGLGKMFEDDELNIKILNYLTRTWEPKITMIKESKDLASMSMEDFFGKLIAYEHELIQQCHTEETKNKRKGIALKFNSSKENYKESSSDDKDAKNLSLMLKKFRKFLKRFKKRKFSKPSKNIESKNNTFTCFECGKQGHIKSECPIYLRK